MTKLLTTDLNLQKTELFFQFCFRKSGICFHILVFRNFSSDQFISLDIIFRLIKKTCQNELHSVNLFIDNNMRYWESVDYFC